ncbi:MAG TPA: DUF488 domain-containing protein [Acidobacteriaceae bacterium]|jgi:uncharacterized protein (DUF488 family)|nr:DUF488 domain-containing protein [Acidobacteriaceae bacterium]
MLTLGHSTLSVEIFLDVLKQNDCSTLIDVRTVPRSRYNPQFSRENLESSVHHAGISYRWMPELGGLRHARKNSPNMAWKNASFRGYADYMQTAEFAEALEKLIAINQSSASRKSVILCAEAVPWRCHRSLIGDALLVRGVPVEDIFVQKNGSSIRKPHRLTPFAHLEGTCLTYPGEQQALALE